MPESLHYFDILRAWRDQGHARSFSLSVGTSVGLTLTDAEDAVEIERPGEGPDLLPYVIGLALGECRRRKAERLAGSSGGPLRPRSRALA